MNRSMGILRGTVRPFRTKRPTASSPILRQNRALPPLLVRAIASPSPPSPAAPAGSRARSTAPAAPLAPPSEAHLQRNAELVERLRGQTILAPLTKGNNLPFRRLCCDFGAEVTTSEMGFARQLNRGAPKERALLRRAPNEKFYGVQIATNTIDEGVTAGKLAAAAGADWIDLNCGCPIYEATRRGLGSALLRKPAKLQRLVAEMAAQLPIPLTVKVRTGVSESSINVEAVVAALRDAGAAAVTVHGRTALQRYKKACNWDLISDVARSAGNFPVIGNGDILTHYEAARRLAPGNAVHAVMVGRGALIKPWIFQEVKEGRELAPSAEDRVGIYRRLVSHMKEHFGDDAMGRKKAWYFFPWHLGFFCRYRSLPEDVFGAQSLEQPLISTRWDSVACPELGETLEGLPLLERLLRCEYDTAHEHMAAILWEAGSDAEAVAQLEALAAANVAEWEVESRSSDRDQQRDDRTEG